MPVLPDDNTDVEIALSTLTYPCCCVFDISIVFFLCPNKPNCYLLPPPYCPLPTCGHLITSVNTPLVRHRNGNTWAASLTWLPFKFCTQKWRLSSPLFLCPGVTCLRFRHKHEHAGFFWEGGLFLASRKVKFPWCPHASCFHVNVYILLHTYMYANWSSMFLRQCGAPFLMSPCQKRCRPRKQTKFSVQRGMQAAIY